MNGIFTPRLLFWLFAGSLFDLQFADGAHNTSCYTGCICCIGRWCGYSKGYQNACLHGCIDGHRGARCYELCTYNCKSCVDKIHECETCYDGFFLGSNKDCKSRCPVNCKTCTSDTRCRECEEGFENRDGSQTCEYNICPQNCICNKTSCVSCKQGFYHTATSCVNNCPPNCETCASSQYCDICKHGYYNGYEFDIISNRHLSNCTNKCRLSCLSCSSYNFCLKCSKGKYGVNCTETCSAGCDDNSCAMNSGACNCLSNFSGEKCTECVTGKYGNTCDKSCPVNCKSKLCDKLSGNCTKGCVNDTITGGMCNICITGMYGEHCNIPCPENCRYNNCTKGTGACSDGCKSNFDGRTCTECISGRFGEKCIHACPKTCANNICEKQSGNCLQCKNSFAGVRCNACAPGFYGSNCKQKCSLYCLNDTCDIDNGECRYGCKENYTGDKCCLNNKNCVKCSSNSECQECLSGYFQSSCQQKCPENCQGSCEFSTGVCTDCVINRFGILCNFTCSDKCNASQSNANSCASSNGTCLHGCQDGFFGHTCNETCSNLCIDNLCTREKGLCIKGCSSSQEDPACALNLGQKDTTTDPARPIGPIAGGVSGAFVAIIIGIVFAICFLKIRRKKKPNEQQNVDAATEHARGGPVYENFRGTQLLEDDVERNSTVTRNDARTTVGVDEVEIDELSNDAANKPSETYYNVGSNSHRVKMSDLFSYVTTSHVDSFASEFGNLAKDLDLTKHCTFAKKPENLPLNRYNGIYPYDHSRVTISGQPGFFINACYIDGYNNRKKAYIASLGPTAKTTDQFSTFWLMVWNEKSDIIVMLTNLREASGMKCEKYWPDLEKEGIFGQIRVTCRSIESFAEYTVRTFSISKGKEERHVVQLHYTAWPDKSVPQEVTSLVEFRQRVKAVPLILGGPVIVHCSAGVGRTGTYIALDQLTEEGKCEGSVDVFNCVNIMRKQRVNMVQTAEQYKFLYKSLVHSLSFGCEALTAEEIQGFTYKADGNLFTDMFETLRQEVDIESKEDTEDRQENKRRHKDKNRRHSDIPANRSRVRLYLARADGHHDYINAVFINSFRTKNLFIAAQSPLPGTVEDF